MKSIIFVDGKEILKRDLTITNKDDEQVKLTEQTLLTMAFKLITNYQFDNEDVALSKSTDGDKLVTIQT